MSLTDLLPHTLVRSYNNQCALARVDSIQFIRMSMGVMVTLIVDENFQNIFFLVFRGYLLVTCFTLGKGGCDDRTFELPLARSRREDLGDFFNFHVRALRRQNEDYVEDAVRVASRRRESPDEPLYIRRELYTIIREYKLEVTKRERDKSIILLHTHTLPNRSAVPPFLISPANATTCQRESASKALVNHIGLASATRTTRAPGKRMPTVKFRASDAAAASAAVMTEPSYRVARPAV